MAGESPDPGAPAAPVEPPAADGGEAQRKPKHKFPKSQLGQLWDEFGNPQDRPNLMGNYDSAGRPPKELTYLEAAKTLSAETMSSFYKTACARDSLLIAIGTGFGVGGIAAVLGGFRRMWTAGHWAVGSFLVTSISANEYCRYMRRKEKEGMRQAVAMMEELKRRKILEKEAAEKAAREAARAAEEERRRKSWTNLSNYKFW